MMKLIKIIQMIKEIFDIFNLDLIIFREKLNEKVNEFRLFNDKLK